MTTTPAMPPPESFFAEARRSFHAALLKKLLVTNKHGVPSNADKDSTASVLFAKKIMEQLGPESLGARLSGQMSGKEFEDMVCAFVLQTFPRLAHLRPGDWVIKTVGSRSKGLIGEYEQYAHLAELNAIAKANPAIAAALGNAYTIAHDIVVVRKLESDESINAPEMLVDKDVSTHAALRAVNKGSPLLHASISCKWTMRSDRAQNARSEALNLIRNRKGRLPHVVVVTGEPTPSRLSSLALGTGDVDCVYHFALPELIKAVQDSGEGYEDTLNLLNIMVEGKRLKDISDLPLDLAV
ncbi:NgoMIV family type II restriction endonuclease [Granulicella aggregans]|uniref:NgoMIV family type II restriction endonuclease n=1 Tax=Granulicella aggregans TaxID=474949 RepID=UPI0021E047C0|nr:NgoMIV family type II restriction endonuclease [Granulicella aggregans]